jgi:hypothetical protein
MRPRHAIAVKRAAAIENITAARAARRAFEGRMEGAGHFVVMDPSCSKNFRGSARELISDFWAANGGTRREKISN